MLKLFNINFTPYFRSMLTPKEQLFLDKISKNENVKLLIDRLGLEPVVSEDFRKSTMVSARVDDLIESFQNRQKLPAKPRTVFKLNDPFGLDGPFTKPEVITAYLETIYGPQPWKYPLPFAPF